MKAKEMFENLGYILDLDNSCYIGYYKRIAETKIRIITFVKEYKYMSFIDNGNNCSLNLQELQAINQQVKELNWYE